MGASSSKSAPHKPLEYAVYSVRGRRARMEDNTIVEPCCKHDPTCGTIYAVFDGHNGNQCSVYLKHYYTALLSQQKGWDSGVVEDVAEAMKLAAVQLDKDFLKKAKQHNWASGSTGLVALLRDNNLLVANTGDSRAMAVVDDKAVALSEDQKPLRELARLQAANIPVEDNKIDGRLSMSRAFGDPEFKEAGYLIADPVVETFCVDHTWKYIVLASDGLWDVLTNEDVANFLNKKKHTAKLEQVAQELVEFALNRCSMDNTSVVLIRLAIPPPSSSDNNNVARASSGKAEASS